jgi:hypothetical protein
MTADSGTPETRQRSGTQDANAATRAPNGVSASRHRPWLGFQRSHRLSVEAGLARLHRLLTSVSATTGRSARFEQLTGCPVGIFQRWPDALVHLDHANIHGDEPNAEFVFHGRAQKYAVKLDWA